jgi:hypothetical protein
MKLKFILVILLSSLLLLQTVVGNLDSQNSCPFDNLILNEKPIPDFSWTPEYPNITTIVQFDASDSYDPDGYITEYSWDFTNDGLPDKTGIEVIWNWEDEGIHPVRLSVCDEFLLCDGITKNVTVVNSTPVANFKWAPQNPNLNQLVTFDASDSFDPDGNIIAYYWDYDEDPDWDTVGGEEDKTVTYSWDSVGIYTITLKVEDNDFKYSIINKTIRIIKNTPPNSPKNPYPTDGSIDVPTNIILSWEGGDPDPDDTVTYEVYFGSILPLQKVSSNQSSANYNPGVLSNDLTYYWNIISWDNHNTKTIGPSWHFTTSSFEDNTPPYVEIIQPSSGIYLFNEKIMNLSDFIIAFGSIDIIIHASDEDSGIDYIEYEFVRYPLFISGNITQEPYEITLDKFSLGRWNITIIAYDNAGNNEDKRFEIWKFL